jgi:hypothetical protein
MPDHDRCRPLSLWRGNGFMLITASRSRGGTVP